MIKYLHVHVSRSIYVVLLCLYYNLLNSLSCVKKEDWRSGVSSILPRLYAPNLNIFHLLPRLYAPNLSIFHLLPRLYAPYLSIFHLLPRLYAPNLSIFNLLPRLYAPNLTHLSLSRDRF